MDEFLVFYRLVAIFIIVYWAVALWSTSGKPTDWIPPRMERWPLFKVTRDRYRLAAVAGIVAGFAVLAYSVALPSLT